MATGFNTQVGNGEYRLQFETDNKEHYLIIQETARRCVDGKQGTNGDRIRAMDDKELAVFLHKHINCSVCSHFSDCHFNECQDGLLKWLQQPAEEVTENE